MPYQKTGFYKKSPIRSFKDLEIYQKTFSASVEVMKKIIPKMQGKESPLRDQIIDCCLLIPNLIAEAYSRRFDDKNSSYKLIEDAMVKSNNMVVYLEQARDIFDEEVSKVVVEELTKEYMRTRTKMLNLVKAWKRFEEGDYKNKK